MAHLAQEPLSQKDKEVLAGLTDWVTHTAFNPITNVYTDRGLAEKKRVKLYQIDLIKKVSPF